MSKNIKLNMSRRIRRTPYTNRVEEHGVSDFTVVNHMLLPKGYKNTVEEDYWHLSKEVQNFPDVVIVFMDEERDKIPDFFETAGSDYNYQIMDIYTFMEAFWYDDNDTPGVVYLNNGNVLQFYQGSKESGSEIIFKPEELKKILENR